MSSPASGPSPQSSSAFVALTRPLFLALGLVLMAAASAQATSITIGAPGQPSTGYCLPFGCNLVAGPGAQYQQIYDKALFSSPILIDAISFFDNMIPNGSGGFPGIVDVANYAIDLSTTSKAVLGLSPIFANNIGADNTHVFNGVLGGPGSIVGGVFTITLSTPFAYNPAAGNLLLNVIKTGGTQLNATVFNDAANLGTSTFRLFGGLSGTAIGGDNAGALVTRFSGADVPAAVPEPASLVLLGTGLTYLIRRRRTSRAGMGRA